MWPAPGPALTVMWPAPVEPARMLRRGAARQRSRDGGDPDAVRAVRLRAPISPLCVLAHSWREL
ncbi:hypothetical protein FRACA_2070006 [Frankia canadensis]|uniref:Uncharacterized protein n=1 Tax=Frankia canadensis TaxID=1836972 RepID=A0A2I2KQE9_9ACTN|nr:hypothetical protein FRACA_2070006 [Frankia canadensis]SOU55182.1 hypothetical protein FRACA_2070006 [Frankia canadensis]